MHKIKYCRWLQRHRKLKLNSINIALPSFVFDVIDIVAGQRNVANVDIGRLRDERLRRQTPKHQTGVLEASTQHRVVAGQTDGRDAMQCLASAHV